MISLIQYTQYIVLPVDAHTFIRVKAITFLKQCSYKIMNVGSSWRLGLILMQSELL